MAKVFIKSGPFRLEALSLSQLLR